MRGRDRWTPDRRVQARRKRKVALRRCVLIIVFVIVWVPLMLFGLMDWAVEDSTAKGKQQVHEKIIITPHPRTPHQRMTPPPLITNNIANSSEKQLIGSDRIRIRGDDLRIPTNRVSHKIDDPLPHFTLVLCSWSGDVEGFPRVKLLLASVKKFVDVESLKEIIFVVPQTDQANFEAIGAKQKIPFRVIPDENILSLTKTTADKLLPDGEKRTNGGRGGSYRLQMALKLGIARHVRTSYYITMDNDVFLKRKMSHSDIIINGKAIVQGNDGNNRKSWWEAAGNILQDPTNCGATLSKNEFQIGVTPAILSREISLGLLDYLEETYHSTFDKALFRMLHSKPTSDWTEYTLYWSFGCKVNMLEELHVLPPNRKVYDTSGFGWDSFSKYDAKAVFEDNSTFFGVVQSINGAPSTTVMSVLSLFIEH